MPAQTHICMIYLIHVSDHTFNTIDYMLLVHRNHRKWLCYSNESINRANRQETTCQSRCQWTNVIITITNIRPCCDAV